MTAIVVSCIQNRAVNDTAANLEQCIRLAKRAVETGAELICLPEYFSHLYIENKLFETGECIEHDHPALPMFSDFAKASGCWILLGSIAVIDENGDKRNRSLLVDDLGAIQARYDKIHMFDVTLGNGETYRESDYFKAGNNGVIADTPFGKLGLSICYDLRFAALYRLLAHQGAQMLMVPAAFMHTTGKAHWHTLLRARAIETGSYVIAPCQYGLHGSARTYGHSLIIDPWGEILAEGAEDEEDVITASIDLDQVREAREKIPALEHDREICV